MIGSAIFYIKKDNIYLLPTIHYNMEMAVYTHLVLKALNPSCIAVELPQEIQETCIHAATRLPDYSLIKTNNDIYYPCESCDSSFEGLRFAIENQIPGYCIDRYTNTYPEVNQPLPDPYTIFPIGLKTYYSYCHSYVSSIHLKEDAIREKQMAFRLKELSCYYENVLFIGGMSHIKNILSILEKGFFKKIDDLQDVSSQLMTVCLSSLREVMGECGWITSSYELFREKNEQIAMINRRQRHFQLYKSAAMRYTEKTGNAFRKANLKNLMKYGRNLALTKGMLVPNLYQLLVAAKGCVDHNYAYEVWELATTFPYFKNIDGLSQVTISAEKIWGNSKKIHFDLKSKKDKKLNFSKRDKKNTSFQFDRSPNGGICSYPPEDLAIENFGKFLRKKGLSILQNEIFSSIPFTTGLGDGLDIKETIRHFHEKQLYVKVEARPILVPGSVVIIFDEDKESKEKYPWKITWHGEHNQESDMAFFASSLTHNIVGPGISRCEYGGFMLTYPPQRVFNVWADEDYVFCLTKSEVLLAAAIDYALTNSIIYIAAKPPRNYFKQLAGRHGKKIIYHPITRISSYILNKLRAFHVLDSHDRRSSADAYIW